MPQSRCKISYKITSDDRDFEGSFDLFNGDSPQLDLTKFTVSKFVSC